MPCNCDYMEASEREVQSKRMAAHLIYLNGRMGVETSPEVAKAAADYYGNTRLMDGMAADLCGKIRGLTHEQIDGIVYDGRNAEARALADWWDAHEVADARRQAKEDEETKRLALIEGAKAKLTAEELRAMTK